MACALKVFYSKTVSTALKIILKLFSALFSFIPFITWEQNCALYLTANEQTNSLNNKAYCHQQQLQVVRGVLYYGTYHYCKSRVCCGNSVTSLRCVGEAASTAAFTRSVPVQHQICALPFIFSLLQLFPFCFFFFSSA